MRPGPRLSRRLPAALLGLTALLGVLSALAVATLHESRQRYEDRLAATYALEVAAATLLASSVTVEAAPGTGARRAADRALARVVALARGDEDSRRLAAAIAARPGLVTVRDAVPALVARQSDRRAAARGRARAEARDALLAAAVAGSLALVAVLAFVSLLLRRMRAPLEALVEATGRLAAGDVAVRVRPDGPQELRVLATAFNAMAADLQAADDRLRSAVESLGDGLVLTDSDAVVTMTNPRAEQLLAPLRPGSLAGAPLPGLDDALHREVAVEHGGRTLGITAARLAGTDGGIVWTARDISERARLERAKSQFVATASHELRSPLTSIKGFVELLRDAQDGSLDDRQRRFVDIIATSTNRLVDLVNDLLDVASLEAGRFRLHRRATDLGPVVEEVVALLGARLEQKGQQLVVELGEPRAPAFADPARVRQVLVNLVTNAHLYTPEGGRITIGLAGDGTATSLRVADTGPGMTAEDAARAFDRFHRGGEGQQPGTGLGLSIVQSLVELHDGTIEVDTAPGRGTEFRVTVPGVPAGTRGPGREALRGRRVLVVEDERGIAELIAHQLASAGVETAWAASGDEALRRLRAEPFDAVTLDVFMPGIDGLQTLAEIRRDPELGRIAVVVVSVAAEEHAAQGEWVVPKPIDRPVLTDALSRALTEPRARVVVVGGQGARAELADVLLRAGVEQRWCADGAEALRVARAERVEVALVDVALPGARDVVRDLQLQGRRQPRAIVLFSAGGEDAGEVTGVPLVPVGRVATVLGEILEDAP